VKSIDRKKGLQEQQTKVIFGTKEAEQMAYKEKKMHELSN